MGVATDHQLGRSEAAHARSLRLAVVAELGLLDRVGDPTLTTLTRLAQSVTGAASAAVHVFDAEYQHRIAASGAPLGEQPASDSMCRLVVQDGTRIVTHDATTDERFSYSSFVQDAVSPVRFYASLPVRSGGGVTVGTLCAFDTSSLELTDEQIARLEDIAELARTHLELMRIATELGQAATLDPLTAAANRVIFDDRLAHSLARRRRHGNPVMVAVIDLDDFQILNDRHGHARGDEALQWVARRLRECLRSEDTVGRLGGDQFGVIAEVTHRGYEPLVQRLRDVADGFELALSVSVGAVIADDQDDVESLLLRADQAMYAHKHARAGIRR